jgi:hypothetical protein
VPLIEDRIADLYDACVTFDLDVPFCERGPFAAENRPAVVSVLEKDGSRRG